MFAIARLSSVIALAVTSVAGTVASGDEEELVAADDSIELSAQVAGTLTVGASLQTTDPLNLRTGPAVTHAVIMVMPEGATVKVVSATPTNNFYQVSYAGRTGWASGTYLTNTTKQLQATDNVYVRSGAGTTYSILATVPDGGLVTLLSSTSKNVPP